MTTRSEKITAAIIGCGAVAEERYLPAAKLVSNLTLTHVVDLDLDRARDAATLFQIPNYGDDYRAILDQVDAVIVATPPQSHAPISIECLNRGVHVLCEKPLAPSVEEGRAMLAASQRSQTHLAVGMIRRLSWSARLLRRLVHCGMLGDIQRFDAQEGGEFQWPLRTAHIFQDSDSGGVLADAGSHIFDLLLWSLGSREAQLVRCQDDGWQGTAANAIVELTVAWNGQPVPGRVELSFTRSLRNSLKIYGENGALEAPTLGGPEVLFYPADEQSEPVVMKLPQARQTKRREDFALQLSNFAASILRNEKNYATADQVLATIAVINACRRSRELLIQPWETQHLETFFEGIKNEQ